ncbi:hypothetical protein PC119_g22335 [Phytophthora cactorum]|nr:hypothetical protein PC119_g22335 [Phytophthora cactorum]KAG4042108.1 hypothetical protein PC123_g22393 [Phytophthora cactorum]
MIVLTAVASRQLVANFAMERMSGANEAEAGAVSVSVRRCIEVCVDPFGVSVVTRSMKESCSRPDPLSASTRSVGFNFHHRVVGRINRRRP